MVEYCSSKDEKDILFVVGGVEDEEDHICVLRNPFGFVITFSLLRGHYISRLTAIHARPASWYIFTPPFINGYRQQPAGLSLEI